MQGNHENSLSPSDEFFFIYATYKEKWLVYKISGNNHWKI